MRALSIRQPYAELILLGRKTIEFRSFATRIVGERFWIYAAKSPVSEYQLAATEQTAKRIWSDDLAVTGRNTGEAPVPRWMMQLAEQLILDKLPKGLIVGSAIISHCTNDADGYQWHLKEVQRLKRPREVKNHPQPMWFNPF